MTTTRIELVYFEGCPNAESARNSIREAVVASGADMEWKEWNLTAPETPESFRVFGSPTVLVDGVDVTGASGGADAMSCRVDGAPPAALIASKLG
jgi:hypothetical protein